MMMMMRSCQTLLALANALDNYEETVYLITLLVAIALSVIIPLIPEGVKRCRFVMSVGILNYLIFCRSRIAYVIASAGGTLLLILTKQRLIYSYLWPFSILFLARFLHLLNIVVLGPLANVILLLLTLRVIDFACFIAHENEQQKKEQKEDCCRDAFHPNDPNEGRQDPWHLAFLFASHMCFFPGLWSGPLIPPGNVFAALLPVPAVHVTNRETRPISSDFRCEDRKSDEHVKEHSEDGAERHGAAQSGSTVQMRTEARPKAPSASQKNHPASTPRSETKISKQCESSSLAVPQPNSKGHRAPHLHSHYVNAVSFLCMRLYQTSFHLFILAIASPYSIQWMGAKMSELQHLIGLSPDVSFLSLLPSSIFSFATPIVSWLESMLLLTFSLIVVRGRFFTAWLMAEFSIVLAGVRTDKVFTLQKAVHSVNSQEYYNAVRPCATIRLNEQESTRNDEVLVAPAAYLRCPIVLSYIMSKQRYADVLVASSIFCNYSAIGVELGRSLPAVLRCWNCTVQLWLVRNVYKAESMKRRPSLQRRLTVFFISSFWHGLHPGYYMAFLVLPFYQYTQSVFQTGLDQLFPTPGRHHVRNESDTSFRPKKEEGIDKKILQRNSLIKDCLNIATTSLIFSFCATSFLCLTLAKTLEIWRKLSYYGFYLASILWCSGMLILVFESRKPKRFTKSDLKEN